MEEMLYSYANGAVKRRVVIHEYMHAPPNCCG